MMAVVRAVTPQQARREAKESWNATMGVGIQHWSDRNLHVESMKNLIDGWVY
jgi:hypothetical protein